MTKNWIDEVKFNSNGLVPVVTQDFESGRVLMLAWANAEALHEAQVTGRGVYFSRSRGKLWRKGEESGNVQKLHEIRLDCDGDSVLYIVTQVGGCPAIPDERAAFIANLKTTNGTSPIRSSFRRIGYMPISTKDNASGRLRAASCCQGTLKPKVWHWSQKLTGSSCM